MGRIDFSTHRSDGIKLEAWGIALMVLALMAALALLSFHPADVFTFGEAASTGRTQNMVGPFGAYFADFLLGLLGAGALVIVFTLAGFGLGFLIDRPIRVGIREIVGYLTFLFSSLCLFHLFFTTHRLFGHKPGGTIGEISGEILKSLFSQTGASILVFGIFFISLLLTTRISLVLCCHKLSLSLVGLLGSLNPFGMTKSVKVAEDDDEEFDAYDDAQEDDEDEDLDNRAGGKRSKKKTKRGEKATRSDSGDLSEETLTMDEGDDQWVMGEGWNGDSEDHSCAGNKLKTKQGKGSRTRTPKGINSDYDTEIVDDEPAIIFEEALVTPSARKKKTHDSSGLENMPAIETPSGYFNLPEVAILDEPPHTRARVDVAKLKDTARKLEEKLADYGVNGKVVEIRPGPVVTMFEFAPGPGIKISRIAGLSDDLAMALSAIRVRIVAPIPGKGVVGIEVPNQVRETVYLREMLADDIFANSKARLPLAIGKDITGNPIVEDLARMPHLLVAGSTGSGKSVAVNAMLISLLYKYGPKDLRMILVDPKMLEFNIYDDIPHLLLPVVTDPKKAASALRWAVDEMERRYAKMADMGVRNVIDYNRRAAKAREEALKFHSLEAETDTNGEYSESGSDMGQEDTPHFPYIVVVIDEFCDLMMVASKDVESAVMRLAQKARAAGIHLILATQRPSVDVITGTIKANFPSRIAFRVAQKEDSRTVLGTIGAEALLGNGDMLFLRTGSTLERVHGPFVSDDEIKGVTRFLREQGNPNYDMDILAAQESSDEDGDGNGSEEYDERWDEAINLVAQKRIASASMLQRMLRVGYNRAARMIERMEQEGIVGQGDGAKPRDVLIPPPP